MEWFERMLSRVEDTLHVLGCTALVLIAVLINADILSRLLFQAPVQFQFEMVEFYLMPAVATLSLSRVFRDGGHLSLEFVDPRMFGTLWPFVRRVMLLLSGFFFTAVTIMSGRLTAGAFARNEVYFGIIDWPLGWAFLSVPLGCAVLTLRLFFNTIRRSTQSASPC
ncbi:TRAP transporter small permease [Roseibium sp.]|uniref:TRAP transporter small permease n=1 Tax=Roseibium sp. TaxID=1936156 RepID=UPI003A983D45